jgi:hypothetical protein
MDNVCNTVLLIAGLAPSSLKTVFMPELKAPGQPAGTAAACTAKTTRNIRCCGFVMQLDAGAASQDSLRI